MTNPPTTASIAKAIAGWGFVALLALVIIGGLINALSRPTGPDPDQLCEQHMTSLLKAPSTADFGGYTTRTAPSGGLMVTGHVDSQNGFGARIRTTFTCQIDNGQVTDLVHVP